MKLKFDTLADLLRGVLGDRVAEAEHFGELFAEDAVFDFPFAPEGTPRRLEGRAMIVDHLARLSPMLEFGEFTLLDTCSSADKVVFEASCRGRNVATGLPYDQHYISAITLRDGRISHYRDYWNPLILIRAFGGERALVQAYADAGSGG